MKSHPKFRYAVTEEQVFELDNQATAFLHRHGFVGESDHCVQAPTSFKHLAIRRDSKGRIDTDANFQTCQFDPALGRGTDPNAFMGSYSGGVDYGGSGGSEENETTSLKENTSKFDGAFDGVRDVELQSPFPSTLKLIVDAAEGFQSFGVKEVRENKPTGVQIGVISRSQPRPRLKTIKNWWVFRIDTFKSFLNDVSQGPRDAKRVAMKAAVALYCFYYLNLSDEEIFDGNRELFKNVAALKTFRQQMFKRGCSRFGEGQDPFGPWEGRHDDAVWRQIREGLEQKKQQGSEGIKATNGAIDIEEPETELPLRVPVSQEDEECVLRL